MSTVLGAPGLMIVSGGGAAGGVTSYNGRTGVVVPAAGDYTSTQVTNSSTVAGATVTAALDALKAIAGVVSFNTRTGAVVPAAGDYTSTQVTNSSGVSGATVTAALDALAALITANTSSIALKANNLMSLVTVSGTSKTLGLTDAFTKQECTNASAVTITVPTNASVAFGVGTWIGLGQIGAGQITVAASGGVTLQSEASMVKTAGQFTDLWLLKRATDTWQLTGRLAA